MYTNKHRTLWLAGAPASAVALNSYNIFIHLHTHTKTKRGTLWLAGAPASAVALISYNICPFWYVLGIGQSSANSLLTHCIWRK